MVMVDEQVAERDCTVLALPRAAFELALHATLLRVVADQVFFFFPDTLKPRVESHTSL